jgi:hypothetical protein
MCPPAVRVHLLCHADSCVTMHGTSISSNWSAVTSMTQPPSSSQACVQLPSADSADTKVQSPRSQSRRYSPSNSQLSPHAPRGNVFSPGSSSPADSSRTRLKRAAAARNRETDGSSRRRSTSTAPSIWPAWVMLSTLSMLVLRAAALMIRLVAPEADDGTAGDGDRDRVLDRIRGVVGCPRPGPRYRARNASLAPSLRSLAGQPWSDRFAVGQFFG